VHCGCAALLEAEVRKVSHSTGPDAITWGEAKLMDSGFGKLKLLRISCRIDDDLVSIEVDLIGEIEDIEEYVQSADLIDVSCRMCKLLTHSSAALYHFWHVCHV
jgi:hypothetical protein